MRHCAKRKVARESLRGPTTPAKRHFFLSCGFARAARQQSRALEEFGTAMVWQTGKNVTFTDHRTLLVQPLGESFDHVVF